jgi:hypothetical protein
MLDAADRPCWAATCAARAAVWAAELAVDFIDAAVLAAFCENLVAPC